MRLLRTDTQDLKLVSFNDETQVPHYAILSHTWMADEEEITFGDLKVQDNLTIKAGWIKIESARRQAREDGIDYVWIDTCCIDKNSSAELAEAINSMYRWYRNALVCYVFLMDLPQEDAQMVARAEPNPSSVSGGYSTQTAHRWPRHPLPLGTNQIEMAKIRKSDGSKMFLEDTVQMSEFPRRRHSRGPRWHEDTVSALSLCRWFTRGWTLQEMVASKHVRFYGATWHFAGTLFDLAEPISRVTGIDVDALQQLRPISSYSLAQRMCWASRRNTTRIEDRAYSLLEIFDVSMAVIYGEGERAFQRLQEELLRLYSDQTLFAWGHPPEPINPFDSTYQPVARQSERGRANLLAVSPKSFLGCEDLVPSRERGNDEQYQVTNNEVRCVLPLFTVNEAIGQLGAVLAVCSTRDTTKVIVLYLTRSQAGYFVSDQLPRSQIFDLYDASLRSSMTFVNIFRYADLIDQTEVASHSRDYKVTGIMCRYKHTGRSRPLLEMVLPETPDYWDKEACCFRQPYIAGSLAFHQTHNDYGDTPYSRNQWEEARISCRYSHHYMLRARLKDGSTVRVMLQEHCATFHIGIAFHTEDRNLSSDRIIYRSGQIMELKITKRPLLHGKTAYVAELETMDVAHFLKRIRWNVVRFANLVTLWIATAAGTIAVAGYLRSRHASTSLVFVLFMIMGLALPILALCIASVRDLEALRLMLYLESHQWKRRRTNASRQSVEERMVAT